MTPPMPPAVRDAPAGETEFERRTRALLIESAEALPAAVRSKLTQARYAALADQTGRAALSRVTRRWALPAGVLAAAVLAVFVAIAPHTGHSPVAASPAATMFDDVELLTDSDAVPLVQDAGGGQGADFDFYEWAAGQAGAANAAGT